MASAFGLTLDQVLEGVSRLRPLSMRGSILRLDQGDGDPITIWDDSYNSSPKAVEIVLETVTDLGQFQRKILVLGEMLELGPDAPQLHRRVGRTAARVAPDLLVTVGEHGRYILEGAFEEGLSSESTMQFESSDEAANYLEGVVHGGDFLLIKGSRGVGMDRVVRQLEARAP